MSPPVSFVKKTLPYPIYAADFDPYNRGYLVVGGGGGEGRSGVANTISLLDVSSRGAIETAAELRLSRDEDSVMCLANLASGNGLITYAGVNSSEAAQKAGKNEHFRSFQVDYPTRKGDRDDEKTPTTSRKKKGKAKTNTGGEAKGGSSTSAVVSLLNKASLFAPETKEAPETYQRLLRLSPPQLREGGNKRIGAIATGLASKSEIVIFKATTSIPNEAEGDIIQRITPPKNAEAGDIDIVNVSSSSSETFAFAYCDTHTIYVSHITPSFTPKSKNPHQRDPRPIYTVPLPDVFEKSGSSARPRLRSLRFLGPNHVLALANHQKPKRAELLVLQLPPQTSSDDGVGQAKGVRRLALPAHMKACVGMDVAALDADPKTGAQQFVIAVAGQDLSVAVYLIDYAGSASSSGGMGKPKSYAKIQDVHAGPITSVVFSRFHRPNNAPSSSSTSSSDAKAPTPQQQYIRLATTSAANTLCIDTLPLRSLPPSSTAQTSDSAGNGRQVVGRYTLQPASGAALMRAATLFTLAFALLVSLMLGMGFWEVYANDGFGSGSGFGIGGGGSKTGGRGGGRVADGLLPRVREVLGGLRAPGDVAAGLRAAQRGAGAGAGARGVVKKQIEIEIEKEGGVEEVTVTEIEVKTETVTQTLESVEIVTKTKTLDTVVETVETVEKVETVGPSHGEL